MDRDLMIQQIKKQPIWDIIIIGGGATGIGAAIDASLRGYKTLLLEKNDFGGGTSSRSTKLIHGGVRYLKQGNFKLVIEALNERAVLLKNAPHCVHRLQFVIPLYKQKEKIIYRIGLKIYDFLAKNTENNMSRFLNLAETVKFIPTIKQEGLIGGIIYTDCQFDDSRMLIDMVKTAHKQGCTLVNYMPVRLILKENNVACGVEAVDIETNTHFQLKAKAVINATGVWADEIRKMDCPEAKPILSISQGTHLVLDKSFLPGHSAIMVPKTEDGRVLFAIPWKNVVIIGTTETQVTDCNQEPKPTSDEIEYLLAHASKYLTKKPGKKDVLSVFSGYRPLVNKNNKLNTATISREHEIKIPKSGLITITGGKWTTYRKMAEDVIDRAACYANLPRKQCKTDNLTIFGSGNGETNQIINKTEKNNELLHPDFPITLSEIKWIIKNEMPLTIEDVLARRTRILFQNAKFSLELAPKIAKIMANELGKNKDWEKAQIEKYNKLIMSYLI